MDRKGILGLILVVALFGGWNFYYLRRAQEAAAARQQIEAIAAAEEAARPKPVPTASTAAVTPDPAAPVSPNPAPAIEAPAKPVEVLESLKTSEAEYSFTNLGGGIQRITLMHHYGEGGAPVVLNQFATIPIGTITEEPGVFADQAFTSTKDPEGRAITFERTDARSLRVAKKFILPHFEELKGNDRLREEYLVRLEVTYTNQGTLPLTLPISYVHTGAASPVHQHDQAMYTGFNFFRGGSNKLIDVSWFKGGGIPFFSKHPDRPIYPEKPETMSDIRWAGVTNQYFTTLCTPLVDPKAMSDEQLKQRGVALWARPFSVNDEAWRAAGHSVADSGERAGVEGALGMPGFALAPGAAMTRSFSVYAGPREYRRLRELGNLEAEVMNFGIFAIVSKTLLNSMNWLKSVLGNYALAIIVLTVIIKSLMWPLQNKATASMKRMQALQPKMTELREKYKDDPQAMNTEVMKLYKQYGVNPFGGCLPMLVQIPIFFGFYNMLGTAVELRNSKFLWVDDLSLPDTVAYLGGIPVNVLPLLMAATMLWTMALQPKSGDPVQQRVMMFVPLIFIFFCYNFASALALYWTVQNLFSVVQLYATRSATAPALEKVAAPKAKR